jgi:hypothetical protein
MEGAAVSYDLPTADQKFVRFALDAQQHVASMKILAEDSQTVFSTVPCPGAGSIAFSFNFGLVFPDRVVFHVDPGPPPYQTYWNYTVSNSPTRLRIDGVLGTVSSPCTDAPERFSYSNVVAVLIPGPRLTFLGLSKDGGAQIMVQGNSGWTDVIEASTDLVTWTPISTNFMDFSLCPICPFVRFEDPASSNLPRRYYRSFEVR